MLTYKAHPLRTTLEEIIDWKETPVNIDRVGTVSLIEAFRDIDPKEHLIGKASIPLCCETTFIFVMSRSNVGIDRGMKLAASEPTPLLFGTLFRGAEANRSLTNGSKSAERPIGGFSVFDYNEDKGRRYRTLQSAFIFTLEVMTISESHTYQRDTRP
jgi:hypothetical protein